MCLVCRDTKNHVVAIFYVYVTETVMELHLNIFHYSQPLKGLDCNGDPRILSGSSIKVGEESRSLFMGLGDGQVSKRCKEV